MRLEKLMTLLASLSPLAVLAQQPIQPLPRLGGCPLGFYSSGNYCVSSPSNYREAIQKWGTSCPLGWFSSGSYCVKSR